MRIISQPPDEIVRGCWKCHGEYAVTVSDLTAKVDKTEGAKLKWELSTTHWKCPICGVANTGDIRDLPAHWQQPLRERATEFYTDKPKSEGVE